MMFWSEVIIHKKKSIIKCYGWKKIYDLINRVQLVNLKSIWCKSNLILFVTDPYVAIKI